MPRHSARDPPTYDDCLANPLTTRAQPTAADGAAQTPPPSRHDCAPEPHSHYLRRGMSVANVFSVQGVRHAACQSERACCRFRRRAPAPDLTVAPHVAVSDIALPGSVPPVAAPLTTVSAPAPPSVVPLTTVCVPVHPIIRLFKDMPEWLLRAWRTSPVTHYTCIVPLLALGYSATLGDADKYEKQCTMCTERFVSWRAKPGASVNPSTKESLSNTLSCETRDLISWMLVVDPLADSDLFDSLINLESELQFVVE